MNDQVVSPRVRAELSRVEAERGVRVLFACESGSRAWGFASRDSDWDVRFLYVHKREWYLGVENHRDVVEQMLYLALGVPCWAKTAPISLRTEPAVRESAVCAA